MKNLIYSSLLLLLLSCSKTEVAEPVIPTPPTPPVVVVPKAILPEGWKKLDDFMGGNRANAISVSIDSKIYIGLGYIAGKGFNNVGKDFFEFDAATSKWKALANFPGEARANAVAFAIEGKIYAGLGTNYDRKDKQALYKDFYEYDPKSDMWTKKADFTGDPTDQPVSFVIGGKGYFGLGNNPPQTPNNSRNFYQYDPSKDKWKAVSPLEGVARCRSFAFVIDDKAYVGGGEDNNMARLNDFYQYDPVNDLWNQKSKLPTVISRAKGQDFKGMGYVFGGLTTELDISTNTILKYDPKTNTWSSQGLMAALSDKAAGRFYPASVAINDKIYLGLGSYAVEGINLKDFYEVSFK